jgi:ribosomal protein S18 acetylase RimI-like enzyme
MCKEDTMTITIRKAKEDDFEDVWNLLKELFVKDNISKIKTREIFLNDLKHENSVELVLELKNQVIGYTAVNIRDDIQTQGKVGYLSELIIEESLRGKGFGGKFIEELFSILKKMECKEVHLSSNYKRKKAHEFYKALGFNITSYFFWKEL